MKKCTLILLTLTILLNSCGYLFLYHELKKENKEEMLQKISSFIPDNELTKIKLRKSSMSDWKTIDEFEYMGSMYDVVKIEEQGNYVIYSCLNDMKEELIVKSFKKQFDDSKNHSSNSPKSNNLHLLGFTAVLNNIFSLQKRNNFFGQIRITSLIYSSVTTEISSPPPRDLFI